MAGSGDIGQGTSFCYWDVGWNVEVECLGIHKSDNEYIQVP